MSIPYVSEKYQRNRTNNISDYFLNKCRLISAKFVTGLLDQRVKSPWNWKTLRQGTLFRSSWTPICARMPEFWKTCTARPGKLTKPKSLRNTKRHFGQGSTKSCGTKRTERTMTTTSPIKSREKPSSPPTWHPSGPYASSRLLSPFYKVIFSFLVPCPWGAGVIKFMLPQSGFEPWPSRKIFAPPPTLHLRLLYQDYCINNIFLKLRSNVTLLQRHKTAFESIKDGQLCGKKDQCLQGWRAYLVVRVRTAVG